VNSSQWVRVKEVFADIADNTPADRATKLQDIDPNIRMEVERLLVNRDAVKSKSRMLDQPVLNLPHLLEFIGERQAFYPGQILLERFEIVKLLGRGGMGEVYEAIDRQHPEIVAIKTIRPELTSDAAIRDRFRTEVQRSRQVSHPNICRVHELFSAGGEEDEIPFFSMEMLRGQTLQERVRSSGPMPISDALAIALQICAGIGAAHRSGLVHRDLKSSNIILTTTGEPGIFEAKITDFGLARELPSDGDSIIASFVDSPSGTLAYMAPELLEGRRANKATDLYALGVVLYRLVTARYPFEAQGDLVSAAMRLRHPAPSPRKHVPNLPRVWENAILACLAGDPRWRPADASIVAGLLQSVPSALWKQRTTVAGRYLSRRRIVTGAGSVAAVLVLRKVWAKWQTPPFADRQVQVLVQDFVSSDPGGALGRAVRNMVKLAYYQSPNLRVLRPDAVAAAAKDLDLGTVPIRGDAALRVAGKAGAELTVRGDVLRQDDGFRLQLEAIRISNGKTLARAGESGISQGQLPAAVERACGRLHTELTGPAKAGFQPQAANLQTADTLRPDALESFTSGVEFFRYGEIRIALEHLQDATRIDPDFAMAYVYQAIVHGALRREDLAFPPAARAFALRARLSGRQRMETEAMYANFCGDWEKFLDTQSVLVGTYPNEPDLHRQIAHTYALMDSPSEAIRHARIAVELDPRSGLNYMVLASNLAQAGEFAEAQRVLDSGRVQAPESPVLLSSEALLRLLEGEPEKAISLLHILERKRDYVAHARSELIRCLLVHGRLDEACARLQNDLLLNEVNGDPAHEDLSRYWLAQLLSLQGDRNAGEQSRILSLRPAEPYSLFALRRAAQTAFEANASGPLDVAVSKMKRLQAKFQGSRVTGYVLQGQGFQAALNGHTALATKLLSQAHTVWPDVANAFSLAESLFASGTVGSALTHYQSVIARKGIAIRWEQQTQWVRSHAQAARCLKALGRDGQAAAFYESFLRYWGREDQLPLVKHVLIERTELLRKGEIQKSNA
jgi:tetratricopeptide (TPR) repeat protein